MVVDGAGVPHEEGRALTRLHTAANAPIDPPTRIVPPRANRNPFFLMACSITTLSSDWIFAGYNRRGRTLLIAGDQEEGEQDYGVSTL
jgi:hypothetical protein